jgi:TRAP-type C4-dicarboxylate transport system permease small subunit
VEVAEWVVGSLLLASVLAMVVLQAAQRYLPIGGWAWTGELARYALVWLTFVLAGHLTGRGEHLGIEIVDYLAHGRLLSLIRRLADAIVAVIAVAFTIDAYALVTGSAGRGSPVLGIPLTYFYLVPMVGFALTAVRAAGAAVLGRPVAVPDSAEVGSQV